MPEIPTLSLALCMFAGAALYTSVGHAGASAYIALMALFGLAPAVMRPTALALNILVASFTSFRYLWARLFRWRTLWPFLIGALPFAFIGGAVQLPSQFYRPLVGVILIIAGKRRSKELPLTRKTLEYCAGAIRECSIPARRLNYKTRIIVVMRPRLRYVET
jgi:uncharacterized protein